MIVSLANTVLGDDNVVLFTSQFEKEGVLWPFPEGVNVAQGFLQFVDCRFDRCRFEKVGFAVNDEVAVTLRASFGIPPPEGLSSDVRVEGTNGST
jgi:hypothetical protein